MHSEYLQNLKAYVKHFLCRLCKYGQDIAERNSQEDVFRGRCPWFDLGYGVRRLEVVRAVDVKKCCFWDVVPCSVVHTTVSEKLAASNFRAEDWGNRFF
jgi:hypothetical protein